MALAIPNGGSAWAAGTARPLRVVISADMEGVAGVVNAELLSLLPGVERTDGATVAFTGRDMLEVARFLSFVLQYDSTQ